MDDLLREFLTESAENIDRLEQEIVQLEQNPGDADLLGSIFRSMHTIKGTCGFLGLERLESVAHAAENVLGALRDGSLEASDGVISDILSSIDVIKEILEALEVTEAEPAGDDAELVGRLNGWLGGAEDTSDEALDAIFAAAASAAPVAVGNGNGNGTAHAVNGAGTANGNGAAPTNGNGAGAHHPDPILEAEDAEAEAAMLAALEAEEEAAAPAPVAGKDAGATSAPTQSDASRRSGGAGSTSVADATLRVDVGVLDLLMNLAGELVLTRNQLMQISGRDDDSQYNSPIQQLNRVTSDLQEAVMKTRMQPVGNAWGKLPRLVRDLAAASGKKLELTMLGAETELDRQVLQAIRDPLTHMVRNSGDHGVEMPADRVAAGKSEVGHITLEAFHEGGHIVIEVRDDGRGLNVEAIRRKAVERGVASQEEVDALPDHRVFEFIFDAGFSTAAKITAVSGRGVGMDVVRRNIEQIGGTVEVDSELGAGTTFRIKIPLTLAIMSALIVGSGSESFAVPQVGVLELVRISDENRKLLEDVNGSSFYRLRDSLLPLVRLDRVLELAGADETDSVVRGSIVVCQVGASRFGLVVDEILDTEEIVVKPVGRMVKGVRTYAGTTILGDGSVIMILDVPGIAAEAEVLTRNRAGDEVQDHHEMQGMDDRASYLLFDAGTDAPRALELDQVSRLEEIPVDDIESVAGRFVVQYRGHLLPLVPASPGVQMREVSPRPVIVIGEGPQAFGIAVNEIRDILQQNIEIEAGTDQPGLMGTAVLAGKTSELIDMDYFRNLAGPYIPPRVRNRINEEALV
jgi:two-component system chemotaxis sensor kinase CheA